MEGSIEVKGVVLSSMPVGEYDRRLLLLTQEKGKISAFARGARKPGSTLLSAARPCTFGVYRVYQGRSSYTIQGMTPVRYFDEFGSDIEGMTYASYFLELADYYSRENVDGTEIMNLLFVTFKALLNPNIQNSLVRTVFELRMMGINGEGPQVFSCGSCGKMLMEGLYSRRKSSLYCRECTDRLSKADSSERTGYSLESAGWVQLSESVLYTLQFILTAPLSKLYTFQLSGTVFWGVQSFVSQHMKRYIDREFHSLSVLNVIST